MDRIRKVIYIAGPMALGPMDENMLPIGVARPER